MFNLQNCEPGTITLNGYRKIENGKLTYHYSFVDIHRTYDAQLNLNDNVVGFEFIPHSAGKPVDSPRIVLDNIEFHKLIKEEVKRILGESYAPWQEETGEKVAKTIIKKLSSRSDQLDYIKIEPK